MSSPAIHVLGRMIAAESKLGDVYVHLRSLSEVFADLAGETVRLDVAALHNVGAAIAREADVVEAIVRLAVRPVRVELMRRASG